MSDVRPEGGGETAQPEVHAAVRAAVEAGMAAEESAVAHAGRALASVHAAAPRTRRLETFLSRLWSRGGALAVIDGERTYRYAELRAAYRRWCERLAERGVEPGTVVALRADYSFDAIAALLAMLSRRVVAALLPLDGDVDGYLRDCCAAELLEIDFGARWRRIENPRSHALLDALRERGDGGVVMFTTGSNGPPKAALQSAERFLAKFEKPGRPFRTLAFLLLDHIAGLDTLFSTLGNGGAVVVTHNRSPAAICELVAANRVEVLPASPSFLRLLCLSGATAGADLSSLKVIAYGSEPMDRRTLAWLNERFPSTRIVQRYGTTETGSPRSSSRGNDSLWLKLDGKSFETRVVDGVLQMRGEGTILGYLNAPSPLDADGWYDTGDAVDVETEPDGTQWLRFRGRAAETINVGGENVAPTEVEQTMLELPFVQNAVVAGERSPLLGEIVTARVALAAPLPARDAEKRIRAHCRDRLAACKVPVKIEIVPSSLLNARQKTQRAFGTGGPARRELEARPGGDRPAGGRGNDDGRNKGRLQ